MSGGSSSWWRGLQFVPAQVFPWVGSVEVLLCNWLNLWAQYAIMQWRRGGKMQYLEGLFTKEHGERSLPVFHGTVLGALTLLTWAMMLQGGKG